MSEGPIIVLWNFLGRGLVRRNVRGRGIVRDEISGEAGYMSDSPCMITSLYVQRYMIILCHPS